MRQRIRNGSKIAYFLLAVIFYITGCREKEVMEEMNEDHVYKTEFQYFYTEESTPYLSVIGDDGTIFFVCSGKRQDSHVFYLPWNAKEPIEVPVLLEEGAWVTSMGLDDMGNLLLACSSYAEEALDRLELIKISAQGEVLERADLSGIFKEIPNFEAQCLIGDKEGVCYIGFRKNIYAVDFSGKLLNRFEIEAAVEGFLFTKSKDSFLLRLSNGSIAEMSSGKKKPSPSGSKIELKSGIYDTGREKDLLYSQGDSLYTGDIKEEEHSFILNWTDCNISTKELQCFKMLESNEIVAFSFRSTAAGGECEVALLTKTRREDLPQKTRITYGCCFLNSITNSQIVRFNKMNSEYQIEVRQYGENDTDMETRINLLKKELVSGKAPDIIDMGLLPMEEQYHLMEAGAFEDLSSYMEKDENIKREDFLENVLKVYEKDQKLYAVMPTFRLEGLAGKLSEIGDIESWTTEEMMKYADSLPEGHELIAGANQDDLLDILCKSNLSAFVDWETGLCDFNSEEFIGLLEFASSFPKEVKDEEWTIQMEKVRSGQAGLIKADLYALTDFQMYDYLFGEAANFIGYPASKGNGTRILPCASVIAISSGSRNKEGAFLFISYLLQENQMQEVGISGGQGFPIRKSVMEQELERQMEAVYEEDEEGNLVEKSQYQMQMGDFQMEFYSITKEEASSFQKILESAGNSMEAGLEQQLAAIIAEEAKPFFEGQKEVNDAAEIIQNRIQLYMNERAR